MSRDWRPAFDETLLPDALQIVRESWFYCSGSSAYGSREALALA